MTSAGPELVVVGNLVVDDVVLPDGRARMAEPGGATVYAALGAALWRARVGLVSSCGEDYPTWALDALAARGVDLSGIRRHEGPGLRGWLLYEGTRRRIVHRLEGPSHAQVSPGPSAIPPGWSASMRLLHVAPMPFEAQVALVEALGPRSGLALSLDPHLTIRPDNVEAWRPILRSLDFLFFGEDDVDPVLAEHPEALLRDLSGGRLRFAAHKRGARGGVALDVARGRVLEWAPRVARSVDPTGAGDAFAAAFLAGWLRGDPLERAIGRGVVAASFALDGWGLAGLLEATPEQAESRLQQWFG